MTHWDNKTSTNSMRFKHLEVRNNVFKGVKDERSLLTNCTNSKRRKVSGNSFRR